jgi:hypothetical protein
VIETTRILLPISEKVPYIQKKLQIALEALQEWGLSEEEIEQKVNDAMTLKDD